MIKKIIFLFIGLMFGANQAYALIPNGPGQVQGTGQWYTQLYPSDKFGDPTGACDNTASKQNSSNYSYVCDHVNFNDGSTYLKRTKLTSPGLGTVTVLNVTYMSANCTDNTSMDYQGSGTFLWVCPEACPPGENWNYSTNQCDSQCPPGQTWDEQYGFCITPPECTAGESYEGNYGPTGATTSQCSGGCEYAPSGFTGDSSFGFWTYTSTGATCAGGSPAPSPEPTPEDPIDPTDPEPTIPDDGDQLPDPATDEGQETISGQLGGIQSQLQNLEGGTGSLINNGNTTNSLLNQILNQGKGTGSSGAGTGDQDGDGTDDSFSDGGCLAPPGCNGPAIECAIAAQAYATRCNLQDETIDITEADVMAQTGQTETLESYFDETNPENIIDIDGYWIAPTETTATCPADYVVNTSIGSFTLGFSAICDFGNAVRPIILLATWIMVGFMFHNSLLRNWT